MGDIKRIQQVYLKHCDRKRRGVNEGSFFRGVFVKSEKLERESSKKNTRRLL